MLVLFYQPGLVILPVIMDWPATPCWSPVLLLSLDWPAHCLEVMGCSAPPSLAVERELCLGCPVQQCLQFSAHFCFLWLLLSCLCVLCLMESKSLASFMLSRASITHFELQDNWIFRSPHSKKYNRKTIFTPQSVIFSEKYLSFKFSGLLINSSTKAGRRN